MSNRLARQSSAYLLQHADNPVDWHPWGEEALSLARKENKPILLSIGYAACHWCHVMAKESFADPATAAVMNALFVNIKVDREERPDLDKIYQLSHQMLAQRPGGWPLTVFLTPKDLMPFYAGTYFPNEDKFGLTPFSEILAEIRNWYDNNPDDLAQLGEQLRQFFARRENRFSQVDQDLSDAPLRAATKLFARSVDKTNGGFGDAPKFPNAPQLEYLLSQSSEENGNPLLEEILRLSLEKMAGGGLQDHIGGGFFRYCVDARWEIPHFEKMLCDNAQLLPIFACAANKFEDARFVQAANGILEWLVREMRSANNGFYSSIDADSEGQEGVYYIWQAEQINQALGPEMFAIAQAYFGLQQPANFNATHWHLNAREHVRHTAQKLNLSEDVVLQKLSTIRTQLLTQRQRRPQPGLDQKILTAWNALLISGLCRTARVTSNRQTLSLAEKAMDFLFRTPWHRGRLHAVAIDNQIRQPGFLDDHAFLLEALIELLQCRFSERDLRWAQLLADQVLERFEDRANGGFFYTAHDHERLIHRPKTFSDESLPSGNAVMTRALIALGNLIGEARYLESAERALRAGWTEVCQQPNACATMLIALSEWQNPATQLVIRAAANEQDEWIIASKKWVNCKVFVLPANLETLPGTLESKKYRKGGVCYVCQGPQCLPPFNAPNTLAQFPAKQFG